MSPQFFLCTVKIYNIGAPPAHHILGGVHANIVQVAFSLTTKVALAPVAGPLVFWMILLQVTSTLLYGLKCSGTPVASPPHL